MTMNSNKAHAKEWKERWRRIHAIEIEELRRTPAIVKLRQFATLMKWAQRLGWTEQLEAEKEPVRQRYIRMRRVHIAPKVPPVSPT